jgi:hypothetical protein
VLQPFFGLEVQSFAKDVVDKQFHGDWKAACEAVKAAVTFDNAAGTVTLKLNQPFAPMMQLLAAP